MRVLDARTMVDPALSERLRDAGIDLLCGAAITRALGRRTLEAVEVSGRRIGCDLLAVSGGWNPAVQLHAQARGRPRFEPAIAAYVPGESFQAECSAGAANGAFTALACLAQGTEAGRAAAAGRAPVMPPCTMPKSEAATEAPSLWRVPASGRRTKRFIDLQNDVTDADVALAVREGYRSVEHVKRYTTLGMGTDQGKTSNTLGFAGVADARYVGIEAVGTTMHRPPYVPIALGALAGMEGGRHFLPIRRTPMHAWHVDNGAVMLQSGPWLRPQAYPRPGESLDDACRREAHTVRGGAGLVDVSTLGKFELRGPDVPTFLDRVCATRIRNLQPGRSRYFVMLREDGIVFDDGTITRLDAGRWFMTTTTGQSALLARRLLHCRQVLWPELDLYIVQVTDAWAGVAFAGPHSREILARVSAVDASLPHMGARECEVAGIPARVARISFSGERAFEIHVQAGYGTSLWRR